MRFDVKEAREFLKENGFVFTVRAHNYREVSHKKVKEIGNVLVVMITEIEFDYELMDYARLSGFDDGEREFYEIINEWWDTIEKYCKGKRKYLYLVMVEDE
ncbi:hypothetical protein AKJ54_00705 [candidate division MSBL1 archaeon SCGC-AAA382K21]|uniref:ASCH domain-containing protein n=1 Tax=candidate division MSBL1 archaeon SCGC-AAA382K21 TaxID=1698283 RepID=A0A133VL48_9EURY|nr:hypothetical protein AKJ54_00705 [candidate division MSBL1 archaeon SCGC-AAA382K21]